MKKRVSFLGIYDMHEKSEMIYNEVKRLTQNRLTTIVKKYKHHQGMLLHQQKVKWHAANAKLFTENLSAAGVFHRKLLMDKAPEEADEFMGKHSASLARTPKGELKPTGGELLGDATQAPSSTTQAAITAVDSQPSAESN